MPSPFPGMDPYIEERWWEDFQVTFNTVMREVLQPGLLPRYVLSIEQRVYIEFGLSDSEQFRVADLAVLWEGTGATPESTSTSTAAVAPVECIIPGPLEHRETFLVIREMPTMEVVTIIETLSPANKRAASDGHRKYLAKRDEFLASGTNLVELDLLRSGTRLPILKRPPGDYYAIVSRGKRRPRADVYAWTIRQPLPEISIPLQDGEPEARLNLQQVFDIVYDRAVFKYRLDYSAELQNPLSELDAKWRKDRGI